MSLDNEMERLGRILAADENLEVEVRGTMAYATPGKVVLPSIEQFEWLGENSARMLHGLLDHETAHSTETDFDVIGAGRGDKTLAKKLQPALRKRIEQYSKGKFLGDCLNSLEDIRIERVRGDQYIGAKYNLSIKNKWFMEGGGDITGLRERIEGLSPETLIHTYLSCVFMVGCGDLTLDEVTDMNPQLAALMIESQHIWEQAATAPDTAAVLGLATDTAEWLQQKAEDSEGGDGDGEGTPVDLGGEDGDKGKPKKGKPQKGKPAEGGKKKGKKSDDDKGAGPGDGDSEGKASPLDPKKYERKPGVPLSPEDAIQEHITKVMKAGGVEKRPYNVFDPSFNYEIDLTEQDGLWDWKDLQEEAALASSALQAAFEVALRSRREVRCIPGYDEGEVDPGMLGEFAVGSASADTIYNQLVVEDATEAAVCVLIDCSGSMQGARDRLAALTATALHQSLSAVQVPHELLGFTCASSRDAGSHAWLGEEPMDEHFDKLRALIVEGIKRGEDMELESRTIYDFEYGDAYDPNTPLLVPAHGIFKPFSATSGKGLVNVRGIHENLDGESVLWAARRLAERPEQRRVMFVLSDGHPAGARNTFQGAMHLKQSVLRVIEAGIEVYAIGIQSRAVKEYYPECVVVNDLEDLVTTGMTQLIEVLTRGRMEQSCVRLSS